MSNMCPCQFFWYQWTLAYVGFYRLDVKCWPDEGPGDSQQRPYEPGGMNDDEHLQVFLQSVSGLTEEREGECWGLDKWRVRPLVAVAGSLSTAEPERDFHISCNCDSFFVCCCCWWCFVAVPPAKHLRKLSDYIFFFVKKIRLLRLNWKVSSLNIYDTKLLRSIFKISGNSSIPDCCVPKIRGRKWVL